MKYSYIVIAAITIILITCAFAVTYQFKKDKIPTTNDFSIKKSQDKLVREDIGSTTSSLNKEIVNIVAVGDIVCNSERKGNNCMQKETSDLAISLKPDKVLIPGDLQYPSGGYSDFLKYYDPTWGRLKNITLPVPGNHEYQTKDAKGYFNYFGSQYSFYSTDINNWHIVGLNSQCNANNTGCNPNSTQYNWLQKDLESNTKPCILAFWHVPLFSSGKHGDNKSVMPFWDLLYQYKATIVLNGHDHTYERFNKQDPTTNMNSQGIQQFIVGTGGFSLYNFTKETKNSAYKNNTDYGVLKLELREKDYGWQFINIKNQVLDSGSDRCNK